MPNVPKVTKTVPVEQLAYAIREVETGGIPDSKRYSTVNSIGATGAYQVMKANIAGWTKEALGHSLTLHQWLGNKEAQDKVAAYKLGKSQKKYGSWESAAAVWFSGQPNPNSTASDGGNTVRQYVDKVGKFLKTGKTVGSGAGGSSGGGGGSVDTAGLSDVLSGIAKPFVDIAESMLSIGQFAEFLLKLALPSTWVRIVCGVFGGAFLVGGLVVLGLEATKGEG
jgi:hypothetical protein